MGHNISQRTKQGNAMSTAIGQLPGWCILATCPSCKKAALVHLDDLARQCGGKVLVENVVSRLRCGTVGCHRAPSFVRLQSREGDRENKVYKEVILVG